MGIFHSVWESMKLNPKFVALSVASWCLAGAVAAHAQRSWVQPIESPLVHPDRTVTFNFKAPRREEVELTAQFMKETARFRWTATNFGASRSDPSSQPLPL